MPTGATVRRIPRLNESGCRRHRRCLLRLQLAFICRLYVAALRGSQLILSFMSVAELRMGAIAAKWGPRRCALLEEYLEGFGTVYADDGLCTVWARIRADARAGGRTLSPQDAWIAATALAMDAALATNNRRHYLQVPGLRLLSF